MHIAFILSNYPAYNKNNIGGIETSVKNLSKELLKENIQISIFVYGQNEDTTCFIDGAKVYYIKNISFKGFSWFLTRKKIQRKIEEVNKINNIDIIEVPDWSGISAFINFKCKSVIRLHGTDTYFCDLEKRKVKFKNYFLEKKALKQADYILSVSNFTAKITKNIFNIKKDIKIIHNGIDTNVFKKNNIEILEDTILYFGAIIRKKGVLELAEIFNKVIEINPNVKLTLLGKDVIDILENISTLELFKRKLTKKALKNIKYIASVPYIEVKSYIQQHSVIVLPSFAEALPMTWLEAMAMEKAIVASNIGWSEEIMINNKTGFIVNPKDHKEYASKILTLLNNKPLASIFGKNARDRITDNFSIDIIARKNIEFYKSIL